MLKKQNSSLRGKLQSTSREVKEKEQQVLEAQKLLGQREHALSSLDRHWTQLEDKLGRFSAQLSAAGDGSAPASSSSGATLLQKLAAPLTPGQIDETVSGRCSQMQSLLASAEHALAATRDEQQRVQQAVREAMEKDPSAAAQEAAKANARLEADATAARTLSLKLQDERSQLKADLAVVKDQCEQLKRARSEADDRLERCQSDLEKAYREQNRERAKGGAPDAAKSDAKGAAADSSAGPPEKRPRPAEGSSPAPADAASSAELADAKAELEALQNLAAQRLSELQNAQVKTTQLHAALQEATSASCPATDKQLHANPLFVSMRVVAEQGRASARMLERLRAEAVQVQQQRRDELQKFEGMCVRMHDETSGEVSHASKQCAELRTQRDSLSMRLKQTDAAVVGLKKRADDNELLQQKWRAERDRVKSELLRTRELLDAKAKDLDAAIVEKEQMRQLAHKHELDVQQLREREALGALVEKVQAEDRYKEALVRLGAAEQVALQKTKELETSEKAADELSEQIDAVSTAFEETQHQNAQLLAQIAQKEEAATKLMGDWLRSDQAGGALRAENQELRELAAAAAEHRTKQEAVRASLEGQLQLARDTTGKKEEELGITRMLIEQHRREAKDLHTQSEQLKARLASVEEKANRSAEREAASAATAAAEVAETKKLTAQRDALQRRLARSGGGGAEPATGSSTEFEYYRTMVKCPLCKVNEKDAVISKCGHAFCRVCIDKRLELRNRKCPACSKMFDYQAVRELYLTN